MADRVGVGRAAPATVTVTANPAGLAPGTYNAAVTVDGGAAGGSPAACRSRSRVGPPRRLRRPHRRPPARHRDHPAQPRRDRRRHRLGVPGRRRPRRDRWRSSTSTSTPPTAPPGSRRACTPTQRPPRPPADPGHAHLGHAGAWNAITVPKASIAAGTTYWIAVLSPSGRGTLQIRDRFGGGRSETSSQRTLSSCRRPGRPGGRGPTARCRRPAGRSGAP